MMGLPEGWVTDVPGLSRPQKLKALGNGVVPQQARLALLMLLAGETGTLASPELLPTPNTMDSLPPKTPEQIMTHREEHRGGDFNLREVVLYEMEGRLAR
jgi:hypothetical protein